MAQQGSRHDDFGWGSKYTFRGLQPRTVGKSAVATREVCVVNADSQVGVAIVVFALYITESENGR